MSRPDPLLNFEVVPLRLELLPPPDFLLEMFENEGPTKWLLHCEIAENLGRIGDESGLLILSGQLHHPNPEVRSCAAIAVGRIPSESSVQLLKNALQEEKAPLVKISLWIALLNRGETDYFPDLLLKMEMLPEKKLMRVCFDLTCLRETSSLKGIETPIRELVSFLEMKMEVVQDEVVSGLLRSLHKSLNRKLKSKS